MTVIYRSLGAKITAHTQSRNNPNNVTQRALKGCLKAKANDIKKEEYKRKMNKKKKSGANLLFSFSLQLLYYAQHKTTDVWKQIKHK